VSWRLPAVSALAALAVAATVPGSALPTEAAPAAAPHSARQAIDPPGAPGAKADWTEADKTGFGTARARGSNVWFTLQRGRVSEVFYPDLSTPGVRTLELVVTGKGFTDRESTGMLHRTTRPDARSLTFRQVNTDKDGRYRLVETFVTDPRHDALVESVRLVSLDGGRYHLYALHDPSLTNDGMDDSGRTVGDALVADDGETATALVSEPAFRRTSTGYLGASDGWTDLRDDQRLDHEYAAAGPGNVVQVGEIRGVTGRPGRQDAELTLGFGTTAEEATATATASAAAAFDDLRARYDYGWHAWLGSLNDVPASADAVRRQYLGSALAVAAAEDKQNPGAFVASPSALGCGATR
jgi:glucoamylase